MKISFYDYKNLLHQLLLWNDHIVKINEKVTLEEKDVCQRNLIDRTQW